MSDEAPSTAIVYRSMDDLPDIPPWKRAAFRAVLLALIGATDTASPTKLRLVK